MASDGSPPCAIPCALSEPRASLKTVRACGGRTYPTLKPLLKRITPSPFSPFSNSARGSGRTSYLLISVTVREPQAAALSGRFFAQRYVRRSTFDADVQSSVGRVNAWYRWCVPLPPVTAGLGRASASSARLLFSGPPSMQLPGSGRHAEAAELWPPSCSLQC